MRLAGVDLAWMSVKNATGLAVGDLRAGVLHVESADATPMPIEDLASRILAITELQGIAIDAPLIVKNLTGQRPRELALSRFYGGRHASCHSSNLTLYPNPLGAVLAQALIAKGFLHLGTTPDRFQIECYPHPTLIEIFGLDSRLPYKKGSIIDRRAGQIHLNSLIRRLARSPVLPLSLSPQVAARLDSSKLETLRGFELDRSEDLLDSIVCVYTAGLYSLGFSHRLFGDAAQGYICVPSVTCI